MSSTDKKGAHDWAAVIIAGFALCVSGLSLGVSIANEEKYDERYRSEQQSKREIRAQLFENKIIQNATLHNFAFDCFEYTLHLKDSQFRSIYTDIGDPVDISETDLESFENCMEDHGHDGDRLLTTVEGKNLRTSVFSKMNAYEDALDEIAKGNAAPTSLCDLIQPNYETYVKPLIARVKKMSDAPDKFGDASRAFKRLMNEPMATHCT